MKSARAGKREINWTAVEAIAAVLGAVAATLGLIFANIQLNDVRSSLRSNGSQAVFNQQLEVNRLFLEEGGEELIPYFFEGESVPPALEAEAGVVAGSMLDFFSNLEDQQEAGSFKIDSGWTAYIRDSFKKSPVLCSTLEENLDQYGGPDGLLWSTYAMDACGDS